MKVCYFCQADYGGHQCRTALHLSQKNSELLTKVAFGIEQVLFRGFHQKEEIGVVSWL